MLCLYAMAKSFKAFPKSSLRTYAVPEHRCIRCHKFLDVATGSEPDQRCPKPGDLTICLFCGEVYQFRLDLTLENLSDERVSEIDEETGGQIKKARKIVQAVGIFCATENARRAG